MKVYIEDKVCTIYKLALHKLENILKNNGYSIVRKIENADMCIAGVCAAFEADEKRSIKIIKKMQKKGKRVYVYGCMTQVNPQKINSPYKIASWRLDYLLKELTGKDYPLWNKTKFPYDFREKKDYRIYNPAKKFIAISTGCSFNCSFCPHKMGAGNIVSVSVKEILKEIEEINNLEGVETIVLTGTDTACYGKDIGISFVHLLTKILDKLRKNIDIHIAQFNPEGLFFNQSRIAKLFSNKQIKDLQLPIQTASQRLLKLMNRNYAIKEMFDFIKELRRKNKEVMVRTDIMVGFPTERQEELEKTIKLACDIFDEVAVYGFELKKNTTITLLSRPFFSKDEIEKRRQYAMEKIKSAGLLAHSGGQKLSSFIKSDRLKESLRRKYANKKQRKILSK